MRRPSLHNEIFLAALAGGLPAVVAALAAVWVGGYSSKAFWTLALVVVGCWLGCAVSARDRVAHPLYTLSNMLAALREGDYSIRARRARPGDPLGDVLREVNSLGETLVTQRMSAIEATALLRTVMAEIDAAVFAFDAGRRLRLVNGAGERLLARNAERALGRAAAELGLAPIFEEPGDPGDAVELAFPGGVGRWAVRRGTYREGGEPREIVLLSDVSRALREEERVAWQRLVRVLGHELNNSLAPIRSIAASLDTLISREPLAADWREDARRGLRIIESRSEALGRFTTAYAELARLPDPRPARVDVGAWVRRVAALEVRLAVEVEDGPALEVFADEDQLDQALINLVRNAADASLETAGGVRAGWTRRPSRVEVWVRDEGPGLANTANAFVPFFTTKPGGTGIGLVLARQIAEAHGGSVTLADRADRTGGCEAILSLPLRAAARP